MKEDHFSLSPDDPRLTAYALGELDPREHAWVDAAVSKDPALQAVVNEIRALGGELTRVLATEPVPPSAFSGNAVTMPTFAQPGRNGYAQHGPAQRSKFLRFPHLYYVTAGAAAAAFAVMVATRDPVSPLSKQSRTDHVEVTLVPTPPEGEKNPGESTQPTLVAPPALAEHRASARAEEYALIRDAFLRVMDKPRSTFTIDVGTSSYSDVRRFLNDFRLPPHDAVRIEELVNYFPYQYAPPPIEPKNPGGVAPIAAHLEVASAPWAPNHRLVRIGLKGREVFPEERGLTSGHMVTIAKDVKLQIEFNPAQVAQYRLIGYESRPMKKEDFRNDADDAGEIGAGQSVTALYEIIPVGTQRPADSNLTTLPLKYTWTEAEPQRVRPELLREMLKLTLHYKEPTGEAGQILEFPLVDNGTDFESASPDFQFAAAVASFGMLLRESPYRGVASLTDVGRWAQRSSVRDPGGYRSEFLGLVRQAEMVRR